MKTTHFAWLTICALLAVGVVLSTGFAQQAPAGGKTGSVGVCNVVLLFKEYERAKVTLEQLQAQQKAIEEEKRRRDQEITASRNYLTGGHVREGTPAYEEQFEKLQKLAMDAEIYYRTETGRAVRKHQLATREIYSEILKTVGDVAKQRGYDVVIYGDQTGPIQEGSPQEMLMQIQSRRVLYSSDACDITTEVLRRLNAGYRAPGGNG